MQVSGYRQPSRYLTLAIVAGVHLLVVFALRSQLAVDERRDTSSPNQTPPLIVSFIEVVEPLEEQPSPTAPFETPPWVSVQPTEPSSSAIHLPTAEASAAEPPKTVPRIDWDMELKRSSQSVLDQAEEKARHDAAFARQGEVPESLRKAPPDKDNFAWSYHADRFDPKTATLRLSERCQLALTFIFGCALGEIKARGDLFVNMKTPKTPEQLGLVHSKSLEPIGRETRHRLEAVSRLLGEWRAIHGNYPKDLSEIVPPVREAGSADVNRVLIVDTWDRKLLYKHPSQAAKCEYDLYSIGPNGIDDHGERDDIVSCGSTSDLKF